MRRTEEGSMCAMQLDKKGKKVYQRLLEEEMKMIITMTDSLKPETQDALLDALGKAAGLAGA